MALDFVLCIIVSAKYLAGRLVLIVDNGLMKFKDDCLNLDVELVTQKYLVDGTSSFFKLYYDEHEEFLFKSKIASSLGVHIRDVAIVGSGKLGFSIKPEKGIGVYLFKSFDEDFKKDNTKKKSDLDVAIVSNSLFDDQLIKLYEHTDCYITAEFNGKVKNQFGSYILKGWLRPDKLPIGYDITESIEGTKKSLSDKYKRDVNIGIYKSWYYFEKYHQNNINNINLNLMA